MVNCCVPGCVNYLAKRDGISCHKILSGGKHGWNGEEELICLHLRTAMFVMSTFQQKLLKSIDICRSLE